MHPRLQLPWALAVCVAASALARTQDNFYWFGRINMASAVMLTEHKMAIFDCSPLQLSVISMSSAVQSMREIEAVLNGAVAEYDAASGSSAREFYLLKVQLCMFMYDVVSGILSVGRNRPNGFASALALKTLVHNAYEFERCVNKNLVPRILRYADTQGKTIDKATLKTERTKWGREFATVRGWRQIRNVATGHYGSDVEEQIHVLRTLNQGEVLSVATALVDYGFFLFMLLPHKRRSDA